MYEHRRRKSLKLHSDVPVMKGRKWYCLKKDLRPFITGTSTGSLKLSCVVQYFFFIVVDGYARGKLVHSMTGRARSL